MEHYSIPASWAQYPFVAIVPEMIEARSAVMALEHIPCQRMWIENRLPSLLSGEIDATIELDGSVTQTESGDSCTDSVSERLSTILETLKEQYGSASLNGSLIAELNGRFMYGAEPGASPRFRAEDQPADTARTDVPGPAGGDECRASYDAFSQALEDILTSRNPLIQAAVIHYHLAVMRPFEAGNIVTARLVETLLLMKAGVKDAHIAGLSRYYLEHSSEYADAIAAGSADGHNLTAFVSFCLKAYALTGKVLMKSRLAENSKVLFRDAVTRCFDTVKEQKEKAAAADRQAAILLCLLDHEHTTESDLYTYLGDVYNGLDDPEQVFNNDIGALLYFGTIEVDVDDAGCTILSARMDWPCEVVLSDFQRMYDEHLNVNDKPLII